MPHPVLYTVHLSPPCRAVELTAKALGLELDRKMVNLLAGDNLKPEFLKLNPKHTIPVLDDNGTIIGESHAIMIYLVQKFGKTDALYPSDIVQQARVNEALHFESGVLFARLRFITELVIFARKAEIPQDRIEYVRKAYRLLEDSLHDDFVAGPRMTIADFSCISTVASTVGFIPLDSSEFPRTAAWMERMKQLPYYEQANGIGATELGQFVVNQLAENAKYGCVASSQRSCVCLKMPKLVLYTLHLSPPCRAVEMTAKALGLELEQKTINLLAGDHLKSEFLKLNPQHTIPVLDDDGTIITESHAIMIYLVTKYGKDDTLYPKDPLPQARVNAALHFESGVLFARMRFIFERILFYGQSDIPEDRVEYVQKSYRLLEDTLVDDFVAGPKMTIADFSCVSTVSSIMGVVPLERSEHPRIYGWIDRLKQLPYYEEANGGGGTELGKFVLAKKEENAKA
ncbi:uncharacterized protein LOC128302650 [Anopheles moucheti]|uniref:uncharacterized protein LOC128302650 n=1 Tax=Anopheles moucheti TaxID=186751 RepID=UPI0022F0C0BA|nr:uncharacterized protein LOC128302650 [Anopheles moucheti]